MKTYKRIFALLFLPLFTHADQLTIHNRTPQNLYMALYYMDMKVPLKQQANATIASDIGWLDAHGSGVIERPAFNWTRNRFLVFTENAQLLMPELTPAQLSTSNAKDINAFMGSDIYIACKDGVLSGHTDLEWNYMQKLIENTKQKLIATLPAFTENPYKNTIATVRQGNDLAEGEKAYLALRTPKVRTALEKFLNTSMTNKKTPTIALVCSGGGYRAMLYAAGALVGAQEIGLLDTASYMVGLSGSSWAISGWLLSGKPIKEYNNWLVDNIHFGLKNISFSDLKLMSDHLLVRYFSDDPLDIVDVYGALLANELFTQHGNKKQRQTLSSQAEIIRAGTLPFPIYTAISGDSPESENLWYEFSPYEVGASWIGNGMYVPSWAFGRKFNKGTSTNFAPEQNFGVLMATFGFVPGATLNRLFAELNLENKMPFSITKNIVDRILKDYGQKRLTTSNFNNFSFGMPESPYADQPIIKLIDAGINFNLPYPAVSGQRKERTADIIIFIEATANSLERELRDAQGYARRHNLKFPPIQYENIKKRTVTIFKDEHDQQTPVVIYLPRISEKSLIEGYKNIQGFESLCATLCDFDVEQCINSGVCSTLNFNYPAKEARAMSALGEFNVRSAKEAIIEAIRSKVNWEERQIGTKLFRK